MAEEVARTENGHGFGGVPVATKAGPLLFLSSVLPLHGETGRIVRQVEDVPETQGLGAPAYVTSRWQGPIKAQTWMIYENLRSILAANGRSLDDVVRQRIFLRDVDDTYAMEDVMLSFFPGEKPCTWISAMGQNGMNPEILIQVDVVALSDGEVIKETIVVPDLESATSPYPNAVRVGDLVFLGAFMGTNLKDGRLPMRLDELPSEASKLVLPHDGRGLAPTEAMRAQQWLVVDHMRRVLEHIGGNLADLLRIFRFFAGQPKHRVVALQHNVFGEPRQNAPATTGFTIGRPSVIEDCYVLADGIALAPGTNGKLIGPEEPTMEYCNVVTRGGQYCFVSGALAMNTKTNSLVRNFGDLEMERPPLMAHAIHANQNAMAQAWHVYRTLDSVLKEMESGLDRVVQQNVFLRDARDYVAVERVGEIAFGGKLPPTTVIPVDGIGPDPDLLMEIETISVVD